MKKDPIKVNQSHKEVNGNVMKCGHLTLMFMYLLCNFPRLPRVYSMITSYVAARGRSRSAAKRRRSSCLAALELGRLNLLDFEIN